MPGQGAATIYQCRQIYFAAMDPDLDDGEETLLQTLSRRYAYLSAWLLRLNRAPEPSRLPEPTRPLSPTRANIPARQPHPPRPE
jgi:hypothetical protein